MQWLGVDKDEPVVPSDLFRMRAALLSRYASITAPRRHTRQIPPPGTTDKKHKRNVKATTLKEKQHPS